MADDKKPSEVLGGWNQQVAEQLGQIADNTGGEGTAQASAEKRPSDVLGGWYKEVSDLLDDIATNTEGGGGGGEYVLPTMSPTTKGGATVGEGLTMDGNALSVDFTEVASVDALEEATALSPTGGIVSTQDGLAISATQQTEGAIDGALLELTAKSKPATQQTTTGKNLARNNESQQTTVNGVTFTRQSDGSIHVSGSSTSAFAFYNMQPLTDTFQPGTYTASMSGLDGKVTAQVFYRLTSDDSIYALSEKTDGVRSFSIPPDAISVGWRIYTTSGVSVNTTVYFQFELGSTATPYEPYSGGVPSPSPDWPQPIVTVTGHEVTGKEGRFVSLERRDSQGNLLDTTPIPLPSRGWVAGLPDGTADTLTLDGAGKVVWERKTGEYSVIGNEGEGQGAMSLGEGWFRSAVRLLSDAEVSVTNKSSANVGYCTHSPYLRNEMAKSQHVGTTNKFVLFIGRGETANDIIQPYAGAEILYPLATPVTEDCGYIEGWTNDFSEGCVLSIPELDDLGIKYHIDGAVSTLVHQWYEKSRSEYEDRIVALEQAVAELVAG